MGKFAFHLHFWKTKCFQALGGGSLPPDLLTRGSALDPAEAPPQTPVIGSRSPLAMRPHFYDEVYAYVSHQLSAILFFIGNKV